jgi:hypothetical protein
MFYPKSNLMDYKSSPNIAYGTPKIQVAHQGVSAINLSIEFNGQIQVPSSYNSLFPAHWLQLFASLQVKQVN